MPYVQCPRCGAPVDLPEEAVGPDRTDPWNVAGCPECDQTFDFDDEEVVLTGRDISDSPSRSSEQ